jgi:ArsR family transcriptional regulator, arsenate/arsenite/antimonite-responsive transcriptional repressor
MNDEPLDLLEFFRALSDSTRLQIAGQLAARPLSAEQLAEALQRKPAAIKHHLARLRQAGLLAGPEGEAQCYRLRLDCVHALANSLMAHEATSVPAGAAQDDFEHKVLRDFLRPDGTIRELPAQEKKFQVIVRYALREFEAGQRYDEKEVNARLKRLHPDSATLRRAMIDAGLMQRVTAVGSASRYEVSGLRSR